MRGNIHMLVKAKVSRGLKFLQDDGDILSFPSLEEFAWFRTGLNPQRFWDKWFRSCIPPKVVRSLALSMAFIPYFVLLFFLDYHESRNTKKIEYV